jgi:hypothetical protein
MWQANVGSGSGRATNKQDLVTKWVALMTSQGVATVAVNAAGTGYVVGDVLTLTHAGAYQVARFEVTSVGGGGTITGLRITSNGAFGIRATSATVSAGGTNYAVGDVLEVQGGSTRCKGKFQVATLSGSAVATVTPFEDGGAYSSTPSNPAATTKVGPSAGTGSGCTLTVTYTSLVGTTGLSVTGGTGTGATVDITLAQAGWTCERNTNSTSFNGVTNEKEVVLKGDASGRTNKPYIGFTTFTRTSGINTRHIVGLHSMVAHNTAIALSAQPGILGNPGTWGDEFPYVHCDENAAQEMDFWLSVSDREIHGVVDINPGAGNSDDRQFMQFYAGMLNTFATEVEDPYPMFVGGNRSTNIDPSAGSTSLTGLGECTSPTGVTNTGMLFYRSETSTWVYVSNGQNNASDEEPHVMFPLGNVREVNQPSNTSDNVAYDGPVTFHTGIGSLNRSSPTRRLFPVPGTTPYQFLFPLTIVSINATTFNPALDSPRGNLNGCFLIYNTDASGATIANFALDYITVGSDRYRVFHSHVQRQPYHYVAMKETV